MATKHFENAARRQWWTVHIEVWPRSGLSQRRYCRMHCLTDTTFTRWLRAIADAEVAKIRAQNARITAETEHDERRRRRKGRRFKLSDDKRNQAVQAFWAMHVETLNWSGMTVRQYAAAAKLSKHSLRRWRDLIDSGAVAIDGRARLHPGARPKISSGASSAAKDLSVETDGVDRTADSRPRCTGAMTSPPAWCSVGASSSASVQSSRPDLCRSPRPGRRIRAARVSTEVRSCRRISPRFPSA